TLVAEDPVALEPIHHRAGREQLVAFIDHRVRLPDVKMRRKAPASGIADGFVRTDRRRVGVRISGSRLDRDRSARSAREPLDRTELRVLYLCRLDPRDGAWRHARLLGQLALAEIRHPSQSAEGITEIEICHTASRCPNATMRAIPRPRLVDNSAESARREDPSAGGVLLAPLHAPACQRHVNPDPLSACES